MSKTLNFVGGLSDRFMTRIPDFLLQSSKLDRETYLERLRFYRDFPADRPFFVEPTQVPVHEAIEHKPLPEGERVLFRYDSGFGGHNPALREELASHKNNLNGYLHLWRHDDSASRPLVLCVHGFAMAGPRRAEQMFKIHRMFGMGLDVALHHLPHHWRRSAHPSRSEFLRPQDVPLTLEEWGRNLHDLNASVLLLRQLGYARLGLIGASLGGLTCALMATTGVQADFIFMVVPAVDLESFLMPRPSLMKFPVDEEVRETTAQALKRIVPMSYTPRFDVQRIGVVAHQGDLICPVRHTRALVEAWNISEYVEVVGGHWVYLDHKIRGRTWYGWLKRMGYLP